MLLLQLLLLTIQFFGALDRNRISSSSKVFSSKTNFLGNRFLAPFNFLASFYRDTFTTMTNQQHTAVTSKAQFKTTTATSSSRARESALNKQ